jgi:hypothetical protein
MEIWQYKTIKVETTGFNGGILKIVDFDLELNAMGEKGWELVSCFTTNQGQGYSREAVSVFKRKKEYL